jgi:hypothetical protein
MVCAQTPKCLFCPVVTVSCPTEFVTLGGRTTVSANFTSGDPNPAAVYRWTVSTGTIVDGQGTSTITVEAGCEPIVATVSIEGDAIPAECSRTASCTFEPVCIGDPRKFDEYGSPSWNDEKARLDNAAIALRDEPKAKIYLVTYGGRRSYLGEAVARGSRARDYLIKTRSVPPDRIVTIDGGYKETAWTEIWLLPDSIEPPRGYPTVDPSEVIFSKKPPRQKRSH